MAEGLYGIVLTVGLLAAAYLCGAVPFGLLVGWYRGVDIRTKGSCNIGATNAGRVLGRPWGILVFVLDVLKGFVPVSVCRYVFIGLSAGPGHRPTDSAGVLLVVLAATLAVVGHMCPVYLRFKGGKGVATSLGVGLAIYPYYTLAGLLAFGLWGLVLAVTRYVSVASVLAVVSFPLFVGAITWCYRSAWGGFRVLWPLHLFSLVVAVLVVYRHRANLQRLRAGTEHKIGGSAGGGG
jgi:acyl phosphate:glycerol-3-phosphate acyltransferase